MSYVIWTCIFELHRKDQRRKKWSSKVFLSQEMPSSRNCHFQEFPLTRGAFLAYSSQVSASEVIGFNVSSAHQPWVSWDGRVGSPWSLPMRPYREEWTKHKTKPRRNLQNRTFFNNCIFVLLIAFVFVNIALYCSVLDHNTRYIIIIDVSIHWTVNKCSVYWQKLTL